jgi:hypothetical protein
MSFELASAYVRIFVEDSAVNKSLGNIRNNLSGTTTNMQKGMAGIRTGMNGTMTQLNRGIIQFTRNFKKVTAPILSVAKWYMAAVTGLATKALHALYGDDSEAGRRWKKTFDVFKIRLNTEMARIANILLKVPIFGNTIPQWMDKFINFLKRIDLTKLKELVRLFEKAAYIIAGIKAISILGNAAAGITGLAKLLSGGTAAKTTASAAGSAAGQAGISLAAGISGAGVIAAVTRDSKKALKQTILQKEVSDILSAGGKVESGRNVRLPSGRIADTVTSRGRVIEMPNFRKGIGSEQLGEKIPKPAFLSGVGDFFTKIAAFLGKISVVGTIILQALMLARGVLIGCGVKMEALTTTWGFVKATFTTLFATITFVLEQMLIGVTGTVAYITSVITGIMAVSKAISTGMPWAVTKEIYKQSVRATDEAMQGISNELGASRKKYYDALGNALGSTKYSFITKDEETGGVEKQKINTQYVGLTEGVKFAQDIAKKDNEYLKQIAKSTTELSQLARDK